MSCQPQPPLPKHLSPDAESVKVTWSLVDDAVRGDDKHTSFFTIYNEGEVTLRRNWQLYFNQFPTTFYLPAEAENMYDITSMGGDLYRIETLDSFPEILPGESYKISYQWPVGMLKKTHTPHGLFFVLDNGSVFNVVNYQQTDFPASLTFDNKGTSESLFISPEKRFSVYQTIEEIPSDKLSPVIPTPHEIRYSQGKFLLTSGATIYQQAGLENEAKHLAASLTQIFQQPTPITTNPEDAKIKIYLKIQRQNDAEDPEGYRLNIDTKSIEISAPTKTGIFYGIQTLKGIIPWEAYRARVEEIPLPCLIITDRPHFKYRGQHLDVARNFQPVENIKKIIQLMAFYKLNKLHFHLTDDEGWRLEIPGLPELTEIGAKRGFSHSPDELLPPAYGSGGIADPNVSTGTGFYSRSQFIEILRFASDHHIEVIPEINGPGHARAAIIAMLARYKKLMTEGKETDAKAYLLSDLEDVSRYSSAQNYDDNVMCVCQESTYAFLEKVIVEIIAMYKEAEANLSMIHTGGDEVPQGAWTGSPICSQMINRAAEIESANDLHPYFVKRYLEIAEKYQLKIAGWEEIILKHTKDGNIPNLEFLNKGVIAYPWNAIVGGGGEDMAYQLANAGYEVVMCNASNLYFDLAYTYEPEEPGLFWAGYVDTKNAFELTPYNIFLGILEDERGNPLDGLALSTERVSLQEKAKANILGIQGALWSETLKSTSMVEYSLLPKMLGLAERAWSSEPTWANGQTRVEIKKTIDRQWSLFVNRVGKFELPRLDYLHGGYLYRISPPGAKIENGQLFVKGEYPGLSIRYTLDGTEPSSDSPEYTKPIEVNMDVPVKLKVFNTNGRSSRLVEIKSRELMN